MKQRDLFFQRLNPLTFIAAYCASYFFKVHYWRFEFLPFRCLQRFHVIDPATYFTYDEWMDRLEAATESWLLQIRGENVQKLPQTFGVFEVSKRLLQALAQEFEERYLFLQVLQRHLKAVDTSRCFIAGAMCRLWSINFFFDRAGLENIASFPGSVFLERLWLWFFAVAMFPYQGLLVLRARKRGNIFNKSFPMLWSGISPVEVAAGPKQLDFSFLIGRKFISALDCLYLLPASPAVAAQDWLLKNNIQWIREKDLPALLPVWKRMEFLLSLFLIMLQGCFSFRHRAAVPVALHISLRAQLGVFIGTLLKPKVYISSISAAWPESCDVLAMNALGVRTVNWAYAANVFPFSASNPLLKGMTINRCVSVAQELWVWNQEVVDTLKLRAIFPQEEAAKMRLTGPMMCGDWTLLEKSPHEARASHGIVSKDNTQYIAVFDVPSTSKELRLRLGHGPHPYQMEMLEKLFEDLRVVLDTFPTIKLIVKPKRSYQDARLEYSKAMWALINPESPYRKNDRVVILEHTIDPYFPVAMADLCLGLPFTSPVATGLCVGREGIYHDPLNSIQFFGPQKLEPIMTHGQEELISKIKTWLNTGTVVGNEARDFSSYLEPLGDPTVNFAKLLNNETPPHAG